MKSWMRYAELILLCALIAVLLARHSSAAEMLTPCGSTDAEPPLIVALPDGTEIPAAMILYHIDARRIEVVGYPRVFCDGFEL